MVGFCYLPHSSVGINVLGGVLDFIGVRGSRHGESLLSQLGLGSPKSAVFTKSITCGNIRGFPSNVRLHNRIIILFVQ